MGNDLKIRMPEWARNMYNRIVALIDAGGGGEENVIESISLNGTNVPPDANKNVALAESDPTVPSWAKQNSKPAYTASEVGAIPTTQKGAAGGVAELDSSGKVPSSQLPSGGGEENVIEAISFNGANVPPDANKRVSMTETDPTVPSWAKAATKPTYTAQEVGALPASTTYVSGVKGDAESTYRTGQVNLTPANIGALPANTPIPSKTSDLTNDSGFLTSQTGVTGVKGNAENAYRHGNVNLTPADIGAAADSSAMQYRGLYPNGQSMLSLTPGYYQTNPDHLPSETFPNGISEFGTLCVDNSEYKHITYISVLGDFMFWKSNLNEWSTIQDKSVVQVASGGTGATQGTIDITDYCTFPTGNVNTSSPYGGRLYYNPYLNCVFGTITMNDGASVNNQADIVYLKKDYSNTLLIANREASCGTCVHSASSPIVTARITGATIKSSHTTMDAITSPRYTIMAFLG